MTNFIGREDDLSTLWSLLKERSILLTGPRRVGKTELLRHLQREPRHGWKVLRVDLQGITSIEAAVEGIVAAMRGAELGEAALTAALKQVDRVGAGGLQIGRQVTSEPDPWRRLEQAIERALEVLRPEARLLLCLDEVPWWLDDVRRTSGPESARTALAKLRALRQQPENIERLRMVLTGSVGLSGLAHELGASADINDLTPSIPLRPLAATAGATLFETEITARGATVDPSTCTVAHELAGGFPHWIKMLAERVPIANGRATTEGVEAAANILLSVRNRALFNDEGAEHFQRRHDAEHTRRLQAVLEAAARHGGPAPKDLLITASLEAGATTRKQAWGDLMELVDAWMLDSADDESFDFLLPLFRRWWLKYGGEP